MPVGDLVLSEEGRRIVADATGHLPMGGEVPDAGADRRANGPTKCDFPSRQFPAGAGARRSPAEHSRAARGCVRAHHGSSLLFSGPRVARSCAPDCAVLMSSILPNRMVTLRGPWSTMSSACRCSATPSSAFHEYAGRPAVARSSFTRAKTWQTSSSGSEHSLMPGSSPHAARATEATRHHCNIRIRTSISIASAGVERDGRCAGPSTGRRASPLAPRHGRRGGGASASEWVVAGVESRSARVPQRFLAAERAPSAPRATHRNRRPSTARTAW